MIELGITEDLKRKVASNFSNKIGHNADDIYNDRVHPFFHVFEKN